MKIKKEFSYKENNYSIVIDLIENAVKISALNDKGEEIKVFALSGYLPYKISGIIGKADLDDYEEMMGDPNSAVNVLLESMKDRINRAIDLGLRINL